MMKTNTQLTSLSDALSKFSKVKLAFVFGSFLTERETIESDIDLAIAGDQIFDKDLMVEISTTLSDIFAKEIDLIDLNEATGVVFKQAITTGRKVFVKDSDLLARILIRMHSEEEDYQIQKRKRAAAIRK